MQTLQGLTYVKETIKGFAASIQVIAKIALL